MLDKPISATQIDCFNKCKRQWWFKNVAGYYEPSTQPMIFGSAIHEVISIWHRTKDEISTLSEAELRASRMDRDEYKLFMSMVRNYIAFDLTNEVVIPRPEECKYFAPEEEIVTDVNGFKVIIKTDLNWLIGTTLNIWELKSSKYPWSEVDYNFNMQAKIYPAILTKVMSEKYHIEKVQMIYDIMLKEEESTIKFTKKGEIDKRNKSVPKHVVEEYIESKGLDRDLYEDYLDKLSDDVFLNERYVIEYDNPLLFIDTLTDICKDMTEWHDKLPYPICNGYLCSRCFFNDCCMYSDDSAKVLDYLRKNKVRKGVR